MKEIIRSTEINISKDKGVSVITCTNSPLFINYVFENYKRQLYNPKELWPIPDLSDTQ